MKNKEEMPKQELEKSDYTLDEIAEIERSRTISDADFLRDGEAKYVIDPHSKEKRLELTDEQIKGIRVREMIESQGIEKGDRISITCYEPAYFHGNRRKLSGSAIFRGLDGENLIFECGAGNPYHINYEAGIGLSNIKDIKKDENE